MAQPQAFQASHTLGKAVFSTRCGQYPQRGRESGMSLIIRSDTNGDRDTMAARLRDQFPELCKNITTSGAQVGDYFDDYDQHLHGERFLHAVLLHIAHGNAIRGKEVQDLASRWLATNLAAFEMLGPGHCVEDVFTKEDREEREWGLLEETLSLLQSAAQIKYATIHEGEEHLHEQHRPANHEHRQLSFSQAPPFTASQPQPDIPAPRVVSNPEKSQLRQREGPMRQIPPAVEQFPTQEVWHLQQRLTPSTEVLEHVIPGSTNRANFHSDPAQSTVYPPTMDYTIAIPSRGLPGPFGYASLPRVPLEDRRRNSKSGTSQKGKKNPTKNSSDDARTASYGESSRRWSSTQEPVANYGFPLRLEATQPKPQLREGQIPDIQIRPTYPGDFHVNQFSHYTAIPHQGRPEVTAVQASLRLMAICRHEPPYSGAPHSIPLDSYLFERQLQEFQPAYLPLVSLPVNDCHPYQRSSDADWSQHQPQQASKSIERRANRGTVRGHSRGNKIWIARIPRSFNVSTILEMLAPCRGLQGITEPKAHTQDITHTFVYASFNNPDEAQEALDRLPKTRFKCLGEKKFLKTDWPYQNPHPNPKAYNTKVEHLTSHTSPRTTGKGKGSETPVMPEAGRKSPHHHRIPRTPEMVSDHCRGEQFEDTSAVESVDLPELRLSQSLGMAVPETDSVTMTDLSKPPGAVFSPTVLPVKHRSTTVVANGVDDQADQSEEPAFSQLPPNDKGTFTVDGTDDSIATVEAITSLEPSTTGATPRQPCGGRKLPTTPSNENKTNRKPKSSSKPQDISEATKSQDVSPSENTRPRARSDRKTISVDQDASEETARQKAKSDVAEARDAEPEAKEAAATPHPPVSPAKTSEAQSLLDSSTCATLPEAPNYPTAAVAKDQRPVSISGSAKQENPAYYGNLAGHSGKPHSKGRSTPGKKQAVPIISRSDSAQFASESSQASCHSLQGKDQELAAQHMSRKGSVSTNIDDAGESVHHSSTAATSCLQTERSSSPVDRSGTCITYPSEPFPNGHPRSAGVDPDKLRNKLETGIKATTGIEHDAGPNGNLVDGKGPAPIQTRLKKKKNPKKSKKSGTKGEQGGSSGSKGPADVAEKQQTTDTEPISCGESRLPLNLTASENKQSQATEPKEVEAKGGSISTIGLELRTSSPTRSTYLPEPETPFRLDRKCNLPVVKDHHERDGHERKPSAVYEFAKQSASNRVLGYTGTGSTVTAGSQELMEAVDKAGYLISSGDHQLAVKYPPLARMDDVFQQEKTSEEGEAIIQYHKMGKTYRMKLCDMQSACEEKLLVEQAAAAKRLKEDGSSRGLTMDAKLKLKTAGKVLSFYTPTKESKSRGRATEEISPLQTPSKDIKDKLQELERFYRLLTSPMGPQTTNTIAEEDRLIRPTVDRIKIISMQNVLAVVKRGELPLGNSVEDRKTNEARILLDTLPQHYLTEGSLEEWISKAEQYIKDNDMSNRPLPPSPTGDSKNGNVRCSAKSLMTSLQDQDGGPQGNQVIVRRPSFNTAYIRMKPEEGAEKVIDGHLAHGETLFKYELSYTREMHAPCARPEGPVTLLSPLPVDPSTPSEEPPRQVHIKGEPLENNAIGYWNQNSGFKDPNVQEDLGKGESTDRSEKQEGQSAIQRHNGHQSNGEASCINDEIISKEHQTTSSADTSPDQHGGAPRRMRGEPDRFTTGDRKSRDDGRAVEDLANNSRDIAIDESDADTKVMNSARDDAEYPVLPRGRSDHVKGDDSGAISQGGYAAAARKSIDGERESVEQGGRENARKKKEATGDRKDPWAPDDVWGPGKADGKRKR